MAHQRDIIAILECGGDRWNAFRRDRSDGVVIYGAVLSDAQLAHADLHSAIVIESDFQRSNLAGAILEKAVLRKTDFRGSDLRGATFNRADLFAANLSGADLRDASLSCAFLKRADLRGADLSTAMGLTEAQIGQAIGDDRTRLPNGLTRPCHWLAGKVV